jgi:hypothetical protein
MASIPQGIDLPKLLGNSSSNIPAKVIQERTSSFVPSTLHEINAAFIDGALRAAGLMGADAVVESVEVEPTAIAGLLSTTGRVAVRYAGRHHELNLPPALIVKMQAENPTLRAVAMESDNYKIEKLVYQRLARQMSVGMATCFHIAADMRSGNVVFVMEDLALREGLYAVDQFRPGGCTVVEASGVAAALGRLHAQHWHWDCALPAWLPATGDIKARSTSKLVAEFGAKYRESIYYTSLEKHVREAVDAVLPKAALLDAALASGPRTLLHHDARADNLFWGATNAPGGVVFLDWQMAGQGVGPLDLAWFTSSSFLEPGMSGQLDHSKHLVKIYWQSLTSAGVDGTAYTLEAAWRDYLLGLMWSFMVITQVVNFGTSPSLCTWVRRVTHAMLENGACDIALERTLPRSRLALI